MKHLLLYFYVCCLFLCPGLVNQVIGQSVFINEIHYDNNGPDVNEAIEVVGPAGTDLTNWSLVLYNGNNGAPYLTSSLTGILANQHNGYGFKVVNYPANGIQNGAPDGVALINADGTVIQFLSYEGQFTAVGGPANGLISTNIGVSEAGTGPENFSLQLTGSGNAYQDFTWATEAQNTFGEVNTGQNLSTRAGEPDPEPEPEPDPEPTTVLAFINEIHYDNTGNDAGEGVEIAGLAGTNLAGWQLVPYNGNNGAAYSALALSGVIPNQQYGFGTIFFPINGLQNGAPDGIALVDADGQVIQFLSYEGAFAATNGPAMGLTSTDIGVEEGGATPIGVSLQLTGTGSAYTDFTWATEATATYNQVNNNQLFLPLQDIVFINEIHYDNDGPDTGEAIEIAGRAGIDVTGWQIILYNGNNGAAYNTQTLAGLIPNHTNGFGFITVTYPANGIQNGAPDGVALVNAVGEVVQFISYEGSFTAVGGPANGLTSTDIGVEEPASSPLGFSLQLTGTGIVYEDFTWRAPALITFTALNNGQIFGGGTTEPDPEPQAVSIAQARMLPIGTRVIVAGTLTATDELGGPAFMEDNTGGIAVFDSLIHSSGAFAIGDSLQITASVDAFNQMVQLLAVTEVKSLGAATMPVKPLEVTINQISSSLEGRLITIKDAAFTNTRGLLFPESNYRITDGTGNLDLRIDGDVESLVGREIPDEPGTITGVLGSFRGSLQLLPRFTADLPGATPYTPAGSNIPVTATLDVMTWNMEFFGSTLPTFGPADVQLQLQNAVRLIDSAKADIIAVQEISDENLLQQLSTQLGYERICSDRYSYSFNGPDPSFPEQKVCFLYNPANIKLVNQRVLFEAMFDSARLGLSTPLNNYPTGDPSSFWSSGRLPYLITVDAQVQGQTQRFQLINIHAKSGAGTADLTRRRFDVQVLKDSLDRYYPNANIILLGDYNDDVDESIGGGTTTYEPFVTAENFKAITATLSEAGLRSFISQDNVIDHITISNELYDNYLVGSAALIIPFSYISNYGNTTSDHLPVISRFNLNEEMVTTCNLALTTNVKQAEPWYGMWGFFSGAGAIDLTVAGGTAPYTYQWNAGLHTQDITHATPGRYAVTVTDALGCTATTTVYVGRKNNALTLSTSHINASIAGGNNGSVDLSVIGGVEPFKYRWSNGATTEDLTGVAAGQYTVIVTDAMGTMASTSVIVSEPSMALALSAAHQNTTRSGADDGFIDLTVVGGVGPYTYRWNNGAITQDLTRVVAGLYMVTVTDATGATATLSVRVMGPNTTAVAAAKKPSSTEAFVTKVNGLKIYPNPATERITIAISLAATGKYAIDLYDLRGAKIKSISAGHNTHDQPFEVEIQVSDYAKGVYLLNLITDNGTITERLIINR